MLANLLTSYTSSSLTANVTHFCSCSALVTLFLDFLVSLLDEFPISFSHSTHAAPGRVTSSPSAARQTRCQCEPPSSTRVAFSHILSLSCFVVDYSLHPPTSSLSASSQGLHCGRLHADLVDFALGPPSPRRNEELRPPHHRRQLIESIPSLPFRLFILSIRLSSFTTSPDSPRGILLS
ncbi:hypothetical protein BO82DRAFT_135512 [Aspergillus uvarum CBS 121591]|uniref:Uncharacterized protein n=1 Tax=Aspergillus uvarum CBS 121591 TaxID=1448315 RepID=A0A319DIP5_9EURO|nr:hypothetical protein BO82DRAFT_135512 [Aspergillus uvarum CBS 121591]PYH79362.1 hypothetical protein BO82DRAFT_135512 [Aspergillus uvarum CBS 121591]